MSDSEVRPERPDELPDRYRLVRALGEGGMGQVLLVRDRLPAAGTPELVAMKVLHGALPAPLKSIATDASGRSTSSWEGFAKEFVSLASLRHPNLARVHDFGRLPGSDEPFFTMEYVEGTPLEEAALDRPLEDVLAVLVQLLRAVQYIHDRGYLHLDIKPANVMLEGTTGRAVLLDFGLVQERKVPWAAGGTRGTPATMAPEMISGASPDERTDLYSFGATAYWALAGRYPFEGTTGEIIRGHLSKLPPPLAEVKPGLPEALCRIVDCLLEKDREQRYRSAKDVIEAFQLELPSVALPVETSETLRGYVSSGGVLERGNELTALRAAFEQTRSGQPQVVVLRAEAGLGKSRLLRELQVVLQTEDRAAVHRAAFHETGQAPLSPFRHIAESVLSSFAAGPELRLRLGPLLAESAERPAEAQGGAEALGQVAAAFIELVRQAGELDGKPLALLIEDFHWADRPSLDFLAALRQQWSDAKALLVLSERLDERLIPDGDGLSVLELRPLTLEGVEALVGSMFGTGSPPREFCRRLHQDSAGNPLFIEEFLKTLVDEGYLRREYVGWRLSEEALARVAVPASVVELMLRRWKRLDLEEQAVLELLAVLNRPAELELVGRASSAAARVEPTLRSLARRGMVLAEAERFGLHHARLRETIYDQVLDLEQRRLLHLRAATALEGLGAKDPHEVAHHFDRAGQTLKAAHHWVEAAQRAAATYAAEEAQQILDRAVAILEQTGTGSEERKDLLRALDVRSRVRKQLAAFPDSQADAQRMAEVARAEGNQIYLGRAFYSWGYALYDSGEHEAALERFHAALSVLNREAKPEEICATQDMIGWIYKHRAEYDAAVAAFRAALAIPGLPEDSQARLRCLLHLGYTLRSMSRYKEALAVFEGLVSKHRARGDLSGQAEGWLGMGAAQHSLGNREQAVSLYQQAQRIYKRLHAVQEDLLCSNNIGVLLLASGAFQNAAKVFEAARAVAEHHGDTYVAAVTACSQSRCELCLGRMQAALELSEKAVQGSENFGDRSWLFESLLHNGRAWAALGNQQAADESFGRALAIARTLHDPEELWKICQAWAEDLLDRGESDPRIQPLCEEALQVLSEDRLPTQRILIQHLSQLLQIRTTPAAERHAAWESLWNGLVEFRKHEANRNVLEKKIDARGALQRQLLIGAQMGLKHGEPVFVDRLLEYYKRSSTLEHRLHEFLAMLIEAASAAAAKDVDRARGLLLGVRGKASDILASMPPLQQSATRKSPLFCRILGPAG